MTAQTVASGKDPAPTAPGDVRGARVRARDPLYFDVLDHLNDEALLLDLEDLKEWRKLLAPEFSYKVPIRLTRRRGEGLGYSDSMYHCEDTYATASLRIERLESTESAWAEDPPSRLRRYVTNVRVHRTEVAGELDVTSYLLVLRNRWDHTHSDLISGRREDRLRQTAEGFQLVRRVVYIDHSTLGTANLAIFL